MVYGMKQLVYYEIYAVLFYYTNNSCSVSLSLSLTLFLNYCYFSVMRPY